MSGQVKMRCARCGKPFKSAGAKQTLCPECEAKERAARAANKGATSKPVATPVKTQQPTITGPGAGILVPGLPISAPAQETERYGSSAYGRPGSERRQPHDGHPERQHDGHERRDQSVDHAGHPGHAPQQQKGAHPAHTTDYAHPQHPQHTAAKSAKETREAKEGKEAARTPAPPFVLTDELRAQIEARYQELAQPVEFDGIRTQIAAELHVPKQAVKRVVAELRQRLQLPSWWELQSYTGSSADLERIRAAYVPLLPVPEVGVHKRLAAQLGLDSGVVYQGIRRIRA